MEGNAEDIKEAPPSFEACLKRVKRVMEHRGEPINEFNQTEVQELAQWLSTGPHHPSTEAEVRGETFAFDTSTKKRFPVSVTYYQPSKTFTATIATGDGEMIVTLGKREMKAAQEKSENRNWSFQNFLSNEHRMLHPEDYLELTGYQIVGEVAAEKK